MFKRKLRDIRLYILSLLLLLAVCLPVWSADGKNQPVTTEGSAFRVAFPRLNGTKIDDASLAIYIHLTSTYDKPINVIIESLGGPVGSVSLPANGHAEYRVTDALLTYLDESEQVLNRSLYIHSDSLKYNFSCFAYIEAGSLGATARDAALLLPVNTLGKEYVVQTFPEDGKSTGFVVVATEDNTHVFITPNAHTFQGKSPGVQFDILLNKGESYMVSSKQNEEGMRDTLDMSGSAVCADRPVAVYAFNEAVKIPMNEALSDDYCFEQIPPQNYLGTEFYIGRSVRQNMYCSVTALKDGTVVTEKRNVRGRIVTVPTELNAGQSLSVKPQLNQAITDIVITCSEPCLCYTYFTSAANNQEQGYDEQGLMKTLMWSDPSSAMLPSWEQRVNDISFYTKPLVTTEQGSAQYHYVQITLPYAEYDSLFVDGVQVSKAYKLEAVANAPDVGGDAAAFGGRYGNDNSMMYVSVPLNTESNYHRISTSQSGFVGMVYGFAEGMSYLYTLGYRPDARPDSLFITNEENVMSSRSYDIDRTERGWYQRQEDEFPLGFQRLDTAVVCDSTLLNFSLLLDRNHYGVRWSLFDIKADSLVMSQDGNDTDKEQEFEHMMAVSPDRDLPPTARAPFTDYKLQAVVFRSGVLCPQDSLLNDTLFSVIRVQRAYNDTTRRIICTKDSIRFFNDSLHFKAPTLSLVGGIENRDSTVFIGTTTLGRGRHSDETKHRIECGVGFHRFVRHYESQLGCDSTVIFELYIQPSPDTTRVEAVITHDSTVLRFPEGENIMFSGQSIDRPGVYLDHLTATKCEDAGFIDTLFTGCDSIVKLRVHLRDTLKTQFCDSTSNPELYGVTWSEFEWTDHLTDKNGYPLQVYDATTNKFIFSRDIADSVHLGQTHTFRDYYKTADGCDSNYVLVLTREPVEIHTTVINRPNNLPYVWVYSNGMVTGQLTINPNSTWIDTTVIRQQHIRLPGECPIIFRLEVTFRQTYVSERSVTICDVDTIQHRGRLYGGVKYKEQYPLLNIDADKVLRAGVHQICVDSFKTNFSRDYYDSLFFLNVRVNASYNRFDTMYICDKDVAEWNLLYFAGDKAERGSYRAVVPGGEIYKFDTVYTTTTGCDSACHLTLYVSKTYHVEEQAVICADSAFVWEGHSDSGRPLYDANSGREVRFGKGNLWSNSTKNTFVLVDSILTENCFACGTAQKDARRGCDSIHVLTLTVNPVFGPIVTDTIVCRSKYAFVWEGHPDPSRPGEYLRFEDDVVGYRDTLQTDCGCDSITILNLHFFDDDVRSYDTIVCNNAEPFIMGTTNMWFTPRDSAVGTHVFETDVYLTEAAHCPYHEVWRVTVTPVYSGDTDVRYLTIDTVCRDTVGGRYMWENHIYRGEDHTTLRNLYTADGRLIVADEIGLAVPGTYVFYDSLKTSACAACTANGCDSVWKLQLTILPSYYRTFRHLMSDEETVEWEGVVYGGKNATGRFDKMVLSSDTIIESHHNIKVGTVGCDSTVMFNLRIGKTYRDTVYDFVCENCYYDWYRDGEMYKDSLQVAAGETEYYYDNYTTTLGFDSVFVLALTGMPTHHLTETDMVCQQEDDYVWQGHELNSHTLYLDGVKIDRLSLRDTGWVTITDSLLTQQVFIDPHGVNTRQTLCDSIWTLNLYIAPSYNSLFHTDEVTQQEEVCSNETFVWERVMFVGTDYDTVAHPLVVDPDIADTAIWLTKAELAAGMRKYNIPMQTIHGCDSIRYLELTIHKSPFVMLHDTIGDNNTTWHFGHGDNYVSGSDFHVEDYTTWRDIRTFFYIDTLITATGCDSIVHDSLVVAPSYLFVEDTSTCSDERLDWRIYTNLNYRTSGFYYDSLKTTTYKADSVYALDLTIVPNFHSVQVKQMCKNDTLMWQHQKIYYLPENEGDLSTMYYARYVKPGSCDSLYEMEMHYYNYHHLDADVDSVCQGDPYHWMTDGKEHLQALRDEDGNPLTRVPTDTLGWITVYDSLHTVDGCGCDSTFMLRLYVKPAYRFYDTIDICSTDTAYWHGREYYSQTATVLHDAINYGTIIDCDSAYFLTVNVHQAYYFDERDIVCASALPYTWQGHSARINIPATEALKWDNDSTFVLYDSCLTTRFGCDSIYKRTVTIKPIRHTWLKDTICQGDTLMFHSRPLTQKGLYTDTLVNQWGCDSIVSLQLALVPVTTFAMNEMPLICADDKQFDVTYTYTGIDPLAYMLVFDSVAVNQGFANVEWTRLMGDRKSFIVAMPDYDNVMQYVRPDNYKATVYFDNGYCIDSTLLSADVSFSIRYPSWLMEQHWDDAIGLLQDSLNGGYHFTAFQWYKDGEILFGETKPYYYNPQWLDDKSDYSVALTRADDGKTFLTCVLRPNLSRPQELTPDKPYISVVPTLVAHEHPVVNILCVNPGTYEIYDAFGALYQAGRFDAGAHNAYEVELPTVSGVYIFRLHESSGLERQVKVIVE